MNDQQRKELQDKFWEWIEPTINGYSKAISALLDTLTDDQLKDFVEERVKD